MWAALSGNGSRPVSRCEDPSCAGFASSLGGYSNGASRGPQRPSSASGPLLVSGAAAPFQQPSLPSPMSARAKSPASSLGLGASGGARPSDEFQKVQAEPFAYPLVGVLAPSTTCLLIIDCQRDFLDETGYMCAKGYDVGCFSEPLPRIAAALDACRARGFRVAHSRWGYRPDLADVTPYHAARHTLRGTDPVGTLGPLGRIFVRGEPGWEIHPSVAPLPGELVVDRSANSAFTGTELDRVLRTWGVDKLIVCGSCLEGAVHSTLRSADDVGYQILLLSDCCGSAEDGARPGLREGLLAAVKSEDGLHSAVAPVAALLSALGESEAAISRRLGGFTTISDLLGASFDEAEELSKERSWPSSPHARRKSIPLLQRTRSPLPESVLTVPSMPRLHRLGAPSSRARQYLPPRPATCEPQQLAGDLLAD